MKCHGFMGIWTSTSSPGNVARCCPCHLSTLPICICNSSASRLAATESMDFLWNSSCFGWEILCPANQQNWMFLVLNLAQILTPFRGWFSALKRQFVQPQIFNFAAKIMRDRGIPWYPVSCSAPWLSSRNWTVGFGSSDWVPWVPQKFWMETYYKWPEHLWCSSSARIDLHFITERNPAPVGRWFIPL